MYMFEVNAKCGHVGRNSFVTKTFAVQAESAKEAAAKARQFPRVKHHHKDAILSVEEITESRYSEIIEQNSNDLYFQCRSIQEQRQLCNLFICSEIEKEVKFEKAEEHSPKYHGKKVLRNPKKYINNYYYEQRCAI